MLRYGFKILHLSVLVVSIFIIVEIFTGQTVTHLGTHDLVNVTSDSVTKIRPITLKLTVSNFYCNIPMPNFKMTHDQLTDFWHLDSDARLSPLMRQIAQCEVAGKNFNNNRDFFAFDPSKCYCTDFWPIVVLVSAFLCAFFNLIRLTRGFSIDKKIHKGAGTYFTLGCIGAVFYQLMYVVTFYYGHLPFLGFWYWPYGQMYPKHYYNSSNDANFVWILGFVGCCVTATEWGICIVIAVAKCFGLDKIFGKSKKKSIPRKLDEVKSINVIVIEEKKEVEKKVEEKPLDEKSSETVEHI